MRVVRAGRAAFYLYLDQKVSPETSASLRGLQLALEAQGKAGVRDIVLGYCSLLIEHDPAASQTELMQWAQTLARLEPALNPQHHVLPLLYGANADREELERHLGLPWAEIVALHQGASYTVAFIGFTPGFPYLLGLPEALRLPRRKTPRKHIPAGSVAIANGQAGIYPADSPGGWWVLGQTSAKLFDAHREPPCLLAPGDKVTFRAVEQLELATPPATKRSGSFRVLEAWPGSASLQALPRWAVGQYGMAQSGALDPLALERANALVGNPADAAAIELSANPFALELLEPATLALAGGGLKLYVSQHEQPCWQLLELEAGSQLQLRPAKTVSGQTAYLALRGGFEAEVYKGSASTDVRAKVGGFEGRFLRAGDELLGAKLQLASPEQHFGKPRYPERIVMRLYPGPQFDEEAFGTLLNSSYKVSLRDRMGVRLTGSKLRLEHHDVSSEGSPWGAVQVPPDGQPIILLSDRGRTGGYAKPAICDARDLWQLAQAKVGTEIWFRGWGGEE